MALSAGPIACQRPHDSIIFIITTRRNHHQYISARVTRELPHTPKSERAHDERHRGDTLGGGGGLWHKQGMGGGGSHNNTWAVYATPPLGCRVCRRRRLCGKGSRGHRARGSMISATGTKRSLRARARLVVSRCRHRRAQARRARVSYECGAYVRVQQKGTGRDLHRHTEKSNALNNMALHARVCARVVYVSRSCQSTCARVSEH
jgi:hypothetical protein